MPRRRRLGRKLSEQHLLVLAFVHFEQAHTAEDVARELGVGLREAERLCMELEEAGYLQPVTVQ
jgi:hypothetical protein